MLVFEWDEDKRIENLKKHFIDFEDAWRIFEKPMLIKLDRRIAAVYTLRNGAVRIISLRRANHHEREIYQEAVKNSKI